MATFTIALLQMTAHGNDQAANLHKGEAFCRRAKLMGADLALFPEMWNIGYTPYDEAAFADDFDPHDPLWAAARQVWQAQAIDTASAFFRHFQRLAAELQMALALTYLEKWDGAPRNTLSLIDRQGQVVLTYAKVHTCDFSLEAACTPGDRFVVAPLESAAGTVQIGAMICFDREFPESARVLMLQGAEIILVPNACDLEANRLGQFRARAYENMVGLALANYATPQQNGHSIALDGIAFDAQGSRDMLLVEAGDGEGVFLAHFDLDRLRDYRRREVWGDSFRKPRTYDMLTARSVQPPFGRGTARR